MDLLERFLEHDRWTTSELLQLSAGLTDAQLDQEFEIGHRTLRATFVHIIPNPEFWTGWMQGTPMPYRSGSPTSSIDELIAQHERGYEVFAQAARQAQAENRLDERFADHHGYPQENGATIAQVILHNHGHRTEILHILQRLGVENLPDGDVQEWEWTIREH